MDDDPSTPAIEAIDLTKRYGHQVAIDRVSFSIPAGSVSGLVGPNGAGKTTVMAALLGLVRPTAGTARVLGADISQPDSYMRRVGALIEYPAFHPRLSGRENLRKLALLGGHDRPGLDRILGQVGLTTRADDRFNTYSMGMKQRLGIAGALIGDPEIVVLDEPTNGVDPQGMKDIRAIIKGISAEGRTVLVSSHLLAELEAVCDHVVVLDSGGCAFAGRLSDLGRNQVTSIAARFDPTGVDLVRALADAGIEAEPVPGGVDVRIGSGDGRQLAGTVIAVAHAAGVVLTELVQHNPSLEDQVLELVTTGEDHR
ncbi:MAG: ABC transporter ATP-binding protein [Acidimicrobiales bacterium]